MSYTKEDVWKYHAEPRPGKVEVLPSKRGETQDDLTLAYSPGVADACRAIEADPAAAARLTARSNLVAVVSNGTAVLGLGNIGPLAGKPVMEGKGMLFKMFADVDVFDLELATTDPDELINVVKTLEPTFGGINLEDIKAPECFYIEQKLKEIMNIPVFHDDQHGTAVISGAGLINAAHIAGRTMEDMKVVVVGAGAAGIACANFYVSLGVKRGNIWMFDSKGLIHKGRQDRLHPTKVAFAQEKDATLAEAMQGAHVFLGLSKPGLVTQDMVRSMAPHPVIFACANPVPEITYAEAKAVRDDLLMGTGRSDCPNQINNVSGFPFIFRGALDVQATEINEAMKLAAAEALAMLAREDVPEEVSRAYGGKKFSFGPDYIIPFFASRCRPATSPARMRARGAPGRNAASPGTVIPLASGRRTGHAGANKRSSLMADITARYLGDLRVECVHQQSGTVLVTDAPKDNNGKGEAFCPTDLCATALAACAMTIIGIYGRNHGVDVTGTTIEISKTMSANPRRIGRIEVIFNMPDRDFSEKEKAMIERAAHTCPVHLSLHPDTEQVFTFKWSR